MTRTQRLSPYKDLQIATITSNFPESLVFNYSFEFAAQHLANVSFMLTGNVDAYEVTQPIAQGNVRLNVSASHLSASELKALVPAWSYFHNGVL